MSTFFKSCGAVLLVSGTCIGAGMLALPIVTAHCGFWWSLVIFIGCWWVMLTSSLLVLEVNSALPEQASFSSMAKLTLGQGANRLTWVMFLLLLYALLAAYDTAGSSLLSAIFTQIHHPLPLSVCALVFSLVFGTIVVLGTRLTDYTNRLLLLIKLGLFLFAAGFIAPHIHYRYFSWHTTDYRFALYPIPIVLTAFGSHFIIPTIRRYIGPEPQRLRRIIIIGMLIPLIIYLIWQVITIGVIPRQGPQGLDAIRVAPSSVKALVLTLVALFKYPWIKIAINGFMDIAVTTSFLGISLSLFDFFIDGLNFKHNKMTHRLLAASLTFIVPLLFAVFFPNGFITALRYAAVFAAVLVLILPALMSLKVASGNFSPFYRQKGGAPLRWLILIAGIFIIVLFFLITFHGVPR